MFWAWHGHWSLYDVIMGRRPPESVLFYKKNWNRYIFPYFEFLSWIWYFLEKWPAFVWFSLNLTINFEDTYNSSFCAEVNPFYVFITKSLVYKKWPFFNKWRKLQKFTFDCYEFRKKYVSTKFKFVYSWRFWDEIDILWHRGHGVGCSISKQ